MYVHKTLAEDSLLNPSYWNTPNKKAILVGGGVIAVSAVALLLARSAAAKQAPVTTGACSRWDYIDDPMALGSPGRWRVEMILPPSSDFFPKSLDEFDKTMSKVNSALPGLKVEGAWLGMLAYPKDRSLPSDWRTDLDNYNNALKLRIQYTTAYPYFGDLFANIIGLEGGGPPLPVLHAWRCASTKIEPMKLPLRGVEVLDSDGGVTFHPFGHYAVIMRKSTQGSIENMAAVLANQGFVIATSQASEDVWGFEVYYRGTQPLKWAKGSVPGLYVQQLIIDV